MGTEYVSLADLALGNAAGKKIRVEIRDFEGDEVADADVHNALAITNAHLDDPAESLTFEYGKEMLAVPFTRLFLAEWGRAVVGYAIVRACGPCSHIPYHRFLVVTAGVSRGFIRKGIGSQLVNRLKALLYSPYGTIELMVHERNVGAQLFLRSHEFKALRPLVPLPPGDDKAIVFRYGNVQE